MTKLIQVQPNINSQLQQWNAFEATVNYLAAEDVSLKRRFLTPSFPSCQKWQESEFVKDLRDFSAKKDYYCSLLKKIGGTESLLYKTCFYTAKSLFHSRILKFNFYNKYLQFNF